MEDAPILAKVFQHGIEQLHQLLRREVLGDVTDVELSFGLVVVSEIALLLLLVTVGAQNLGSAHLRLLLGCRGYRLTIACGGRTIVEAARKVAFLVGTKTDHASIS